MPNLLARRCSAGVALWRFFVVPTIVLLLAATSSGARADTRSGSAIAQQGTRTVSYHGYRVDVPRRWEVVDLAARPHACVRLDRSAVYLGHAGDQSECPAHLVGGAPGLWIEPLDASVTAAAATSAAVTATTDGVVQQRLPTAGGPVAVRVEGAGVLVTAWYGQRTAPLLQRILARGHVLPGAQPSRTPLGTSAIPAAHGASVPGNYRGEGFDACTAPSQDAMDAWRASSGYRSVGVYIGGVSRGCGQPNLTATWVKVQVRHGWHLIATYVGRQAPCMSHYANRMSYDPATARAQGLAEARDAMADARTLGMAAPTTIYSDIEAYDSSRDACVTAVLSYVDGWTHGLHAFGYQSGVYSSGASGMHDLSAHYDSRIYNRPDDIWLAWWNDVADVAGGSYVLDTQWTSHQRIHQYAGSVAVQYGRYPIEIDRDFLDVSSAVPPPVGCPTNVDFAAYRILRPQDKSHEVAAAQCQLARRTFDPGTATGELGWRTAGAIRAFNTSRGLPGSAIVDRHTWTALLCGRATPTLGKGSTGHAVRRLQRALTAALRRTVPITGRFGIVTRHAVRDYQRAHDLVVDGEVGHQTWHALRAGL